MIYTLTANPAIDYNITCDGLAANTVTRTRNAVYTPNGKRHQRGQRAGDV